MSGEKRRTLKAIFNSFDRRREAKEYRETLKLQKEEEKRFREEIEDIVQDIEEFLGITGKPVEGNDRKDLMVFLHSLLVQLQEYDDVCATLTNENERLQVELDFAQKRNAMQAEIIQLYSQVETVQYQKQQDLLERIRQLTLQVEELSTKSRQRREAVKPDKTRNERKKELEKSIQRCQARHKKLMKAMEELDAENSDGQECPGAEDTDWQACKSSQESSNRKETDDTDNPRDSAVPLDPLNELANCGNLPIFNSGGPGFSGFPDEPSPLQDSGEDREVTAPNDQNKKMFIEQVMERIQTLEEKLDNVTSEMEEMNYNANKGNKDSNTPSGKLPPWKTCKRKASDAAEEEGEDSEYVRNVTLDALIEQEEEAESASLHDPCKSPNTKSSGKRGKPVGASGGGRTMPEYDRKDIHVCIPEKCKHCPNCNACKELKEAKQLAESETQGDSTSTARRVYDLEIVRVLTEHRLITCVCSENGQTLSGTFPEGVNNWFQYGLGIKRLALTLNTVGMVSYERIADIMRGMMNDSKFSAQSVCNWVHDFAGKLNQVATYIKAGVFAGEYLNCDETGVKVKGVLHWVHVACNMTLTYMRVDRQRGDAAMDRIGILNAYMGAVITDCWASYWDKGSRHGLCNAHILRELFGLVKFFARDKEWAQKMMDLLNEMNDERQKLIDANITQFTEEQIQEYRRRYECIVEEGLAIHPDSEAYKPNRGRAKKFRGRNLLDRLKEHEDNVLLFLEDFHIPFTNNAAERCLRMLGVKRSVVGGFDTYEGADDFALIWSYISSARKRDRSAYCAIQAALEGHAVEFLFDEGEIMELDEVIDKLDEINKAQFLEDRENDRKAVLKAREEAEQKQKKADEARIEAEIAAEKEKEVRAEAIRIGTNKAKKKADRASAVAEKARNAADKKAYAAKKAREKAAAILEDARYQAQAALYFLDLENFEWDFDKEIAAV